MDLYSIARTLHMLGAVGVLAAVGLEWWSLRGLRRATTTDEVRRGLRIARAVGALGMAAMVTQLASGAYMMATVWGGLPWIIVALAAMALLLALVITLTRRGMAAIRRSATAEHGPVSPELQYHLHDPRLQISFQTRAAIILGILVLMNAKPDLAASLLTIGTAALLGFGTAVLVPRRQQAREESTT